MPEYRFTEEKLFALEGLATRRGIIMLRHRIECDVPDVETCPCDTAKRYRSVVYKSDRLRKEAEYVE